MSAPTTLWQALRRSARSAAAAPALLSPQQGLALSWSELHDAAQSLSRGLQSRGVGEGDVVVTDLPNVAEGILLHLACARLGAAVATAKVRGHPSTCAAATILLLQESQFFCPHSYWCCSPH